MPALKRSRRISLAEIKDALQGRAKRRKRNPNPIQRSMSNINTVGLAANPRFYPNMFRARETKTLTFGRVVSINAGPSLGSAQIFRANGLFDPDFTGTGHQPLGFDQMMARYRHFTVTGARIKVTIVNPGAGALVPAVIGIVVSGDSSITKMDTLEEFLEHPHRSNYKIGGNQNTSPEGDELNLQLDVAKFFGRTKSAMINSSDYRGASGSDPTELVYFHVMAITLTGGDPGAFALVCTLEYDVVFTEPQALTQS